MHTLIDADILVYRCGFAAEKNQWYLSVGGAEPEVFQYKRDAAKKLDELLPNLRTRTEDDYRLWSERYLEPVENALHNLKTVVASILEATGVSEWDTTLYLSGPGNFRYDVSTTRPYKGNRDRDHSPTHEEAIKDFMKSTWNTIVTEGEEADDAMGIKQCTSKNTCIATIDKDLDMIPGLHYNFNTNEQYSVTPDEAMHNFYVQLLMGDTTDNIPGLPKVGKQTAKKLLDGLSLDDQWMTVITEYASRGGEKWEEYLQEQGQLLWIRREKDQMWTPPEIHTDWDETTEVNLYD